MDAIKPVVRNQFILDKLKELRDSVGNSPLRKLHFDNGNLYAKLESHNHSGSVKDWAAYFIIEQALQNGEIDESSVIVESSSGNFALALAFICRKIGLEFIPVIDPNINESYEKLLNLLCKKVVKVDKKDSTGGYLLTRINTVKEICATTTGSYWPNQYENENNFRAYYYGLGVEISKQFDRLDYLFVATSSCGTVTGLSQRLKETFPAIKIIAVDIKGSLIFSNSHSHRYIPGIGAGKIPSILKHALIDSVMLMSHADIIDGCEKLLGEQLILGGGSSGAVYRAVINYFDAHEVQLDDNILFISPDSGIPYLNTLYNKTWQQETLNKVNSL